jgi:aryl-alcohol dehydrogenase-like predicted oxidoreductase
MQALETAFDAGITFFDTARSFGFGASEGLLGEFLSTAGRREHVVLCTKFGIQPAAPNWKQRLKPVARAAVRLVPSLRQAVQRRAGDQFHPGHFSAADLRISFERSLRELHTDYVDMLLLHAAPMSVLAQTDLYEALQRLVDEGKVRLAGISADTSVIDKALNQRIPVLRTAQFAVNPSDLEFTTKTEANSDLLLVANHPFAGPAGVAEIRARVAALAHNEKLPKALREKLADPSDPQIFPELVFGLILSGTGIAAVLPAMMQPEHIRANIAAVETCRFTSDELATLRSTLLG